MTLQHKAIARTFRRCYTSTPAERYIRDDLARDVADVLFKSRPRFERQRFLFACCVGTPVEGSKYAHWLYIDTKN